MTIVSFTPGFLQPWLCSSCNLSNARHHLGWTANDVAYLLRPMNNLPNKRF